MKKKQRASRPFFEKMSVVVILDNMANIIINILWDVENLPQPSNCPP